MQTSTKDHKKEGPMKFHYAVTLEVSGWEGEAPAHVYTATEAQILERLRDACENVVTSEDSKWTVEPARPVMVPDESLAEFMRPKYTSAAGGLTAPPERRGGDVDRRRGPIHIDARHSTFNEPAEATRYARCGNCGTRYEITEDPTENHHRAMRHKLECGKGSAAYTDAQRESLLAEFNNQPMQVAMRERAAEQLAAGADPEHLKLTGAASFPAEHAARMRELHSGPDDVLIQRALSDGRTAPKPRRWWQFWRWFE